MWSFTSDSLHVKGGTNFHHVKLSISASQDDSSENCQANGLPYTSVTHDQKWPTSSVGSPAEPTGSLAVRGALWVPLLNHVMFSLDSESGPRVIAASMKCLHRLLLLGIN